jgi:PTH2 family peptidyl-tRNA hydrolase
LSIEKYIKLTNKMQIMAYKQVILVRQDLKLPKGKLAAQVSHASVGALLKSSKAAIADWKDQGMKKVVLKVKDLDELVKYKEMAEDAGLECALITDAGKTVVEPGTVTCLGIGPDEETAIDKVTGKLKMI